MMKSLISVLVLVGVLIAGCGSPKQVAYKTLASVGITVSSAADSYALARAQGLVKDADWEQAKVVHTQYLIAYKLAVDAASGDISKYAPEDVIKLEAQVLAAFGKRKGN